jgi:mRNA interferase MazF
MLKKGTIVLVPFPFTDLQGAKVRPALVVSDKPVGEDVVLVFISAKKAKSKKQYAHDVPICATGINGLKQDSVIRCAKIATLEKNIILGELGIITQNDQTNVDRELTRLFRL